MVQCFAPDCNHQSESHDCSFFRFPKDEKQFRCWKTLIRRADKEPNSNSRMCSCHFQDGNKANNPEIFARNSSELFRMKPQGRKRKKQMTAADDSTNNFKPESSNQGPSNQSYPGKLGTTRTKMASATVSSVDSLSQPTAAKVLKKTGSQFENQSFENREQKAVAHSEQPSLPARTQMQTQQHLQVIAPHPAPRQVQVLALPVVVAQPKPVEKPRPREKRIFVVADHQRCVMSNLASLWKSGKLCDAGIGNGSSTVMVHKLVLSAVCPKLLSVFNMDIMSHEFLQVNFPETVSAEALNAFAEYMYNGILDLDHDILGQLKIIAKRLDMEEFEKLCDSHLPNQINQPASVAASFTNAPLMQTTIPAMTSSLASTISSSKLSSPFINTQVIKQEITDADLAQVKKRAATVFGQESEVASLAPNKSGNAAGFVISPSIKIEPVGPEDDKYGHWSGGSSNQAFTSTTSSFTSSSNTAAVIASASVAASSTEFVIPPSETTDVKSTRLKAPHSYDASLASDSSIVSGIVETACYQSSSMNENSSKPSSQPSDSPSFVDLPNSNETVYPVRLFTARGDNLPLNNALI